MWIEHLLVEILYQIWPDSPKFHPYMLNDLL